MKPQRFVAFILCLTFSGHALAQDMDTELSNLAEKLAVPISEHAKKKVAVIDFTDLEGGTSELGKYIAEQLNVNLVMGKRDFSVLDRANLKSILAEHKLTAKGLVNPDNAKQLGQFAGVDALIMGSIIPKGTNISLTAKIITTDTAEIVGAARATFRLDGTVQQLLSHPTTEIVAADNIDTSTKVAPLAAKSFGDLHVEVQAARIVNDSEYLVTVMLTNANPTRAILITLSANDGALGKLTSTFTDPDGTQFESLARDVSGIGSGGVLRYMGFYGSATEIKPNDSVLATIKFSSYIQRKRATPGVCQLQLEILSLARNGDGTIAGTAMNNLVSQIKVN